MWKFSSILFLFGAAISLKHAYALSDGEKAKLNEEFMKIAKECAEDLGVDDDVIEEAKKTNKVEPCFMACLLEKSEILKDGKIDAEELGKQVKIFVHDDSEIQTYVKAMEECAMEANKAEVDDDDDNCERAEIFGLCIEEKKKKLTN